MKRHQQFPRASRGYALLTVVMLTAIMAALSASILGFSVSERRANERHRLLLRARNMAENISVYAAEQLTTKLYRLRSTTPMAFIGGTNQIALPPADVLESSFSSSAGMEVRAGLISSSGNMYIDPEEPENANNPNAGLSMSASLVPIIAKATMDHPQIGEVTAYCQHDLEVAMIPLFQFAIFYNMDLEFGPGADMTISGPVHANGSLIARGQTGFSNTVEFAERVSAVNGFYANTGHKGPTYMDTGSEDDGPGGTGPLYFTAPNGTRTNVKTSGGVWRDYKYGKSSESATTRTQFKTFATDNYGGNLRTSVHGVTPLVLPSVADYKEVDDPETPIDDRDNGRQIIEPPSSDDTPGLKQTKFSRKAGLYIVVNPDDTARTGRLPDASAVTMLPRSYRCWFNTVNADGSHSVTEVILPGQPSYGYDNNGTPSDATDDTMYPNNLPNRFTDGTSVGHNQVLRIPASGRAADNPIAGSVTGSAPYNATGYAGASIPTYPTLTDSYFYDLRRATGNRGFPFNRSSTTSYTPRPIAKIDFDLTRFRMAVERTISPVASQTSNIYYPSYPTTIAQRSNFIFRDSATRGNYGLGLGGSFDTFPADTAPAIRDPFKIYFAPADPADTLIASDPRSFAVQTAGLVNTSSPSPWFDGVTVYIHSVDAENRGGTRVDSAVRLWNGRGPWVSLNGSTYVGRTGFSFATNDAVYIVGHFNADGSINTDENDDGVGGYSARYPESSTEMLTSVMGDAITILSQPSFDSSYEQTGGWADSLSAHRRDTSFAWSSSWRTTNPSSSNRQDGINTSVKAALMPNLVSVAGTASNVTSKHIPTVTEISTCLLIGIVPTNHDPTGLTDGPPSPGANSQTSGGVHNYPRLLELWSGRGLYIRGSMVAMFESRVAMEPWSIRVYTGAGRFWGLHESLRDENHDLPLEPMLLNARRMGFRELTSAEYAAKKIEIEALPH